MNRLLAAAFALLICWPALALGALKADQVPLFEWRGRVETVQGQKPEGKTFSFKMFTSAAKSSGDAWDEWVKFDRAAAAAATDPKGYPNGYMDGFPLVLHCEISGVADPTVVDLEVRFTGEEKAQAIKAELFGGNLGVLVWRDSEHGDAPRAGSMAEYNRRYWKVLAQVDIPADKRPHKFPIVDRFIGGDDDYIDWREGLGNLSKAGFNGLMMGPDARMRRLLVEAGQSGTAWAVYAPQDSMFDLAPKFTADATTKWAQSLAEPYLKAGYKPTDMLIHVISDEPGWYYPDTFKEVTGSPAALERFHDYLKDQHLTPADLGAADWARVMPLGRSHAKDLPSKRLFYWTMRFFPWASSLHFARSTQAMEQAFYPGMPVVTNWNFFSGREYVPGPVANNAAKHDPDAAMGGHDWFEFARMRAGTMLWTEDWLGDEQASQWSFYAAKMRSACDLAGDKGAIGFGGYVVPRTAGQIPDGIVQKILAVVGNGGKGLQYFVFGPEYDFPGNCYSENVKVLPQMAHAHRLIGTAEELLWPGKMERAKVAILAPRSSEMWDAKDIAVPDQIQDATNNNLTDSTVDYMAEVFGLYTALQHANIRCGFVDEDALTGGAMKGLSVLYVTEPNIPVAGQKALRAWVSAGGHLILVDGAAQRDEYDEPCTILRDALGVKEAPRPALLMGSLKSLEAVGHLQVKTDKGDAVAAPPEDEGRLSAAYGVRKVAAVEVGADMASPFVKFSDSRPALYEKAVGNGRRYAFPWLPGCSYLRAADANAGDVEHRWSRVLRYVVTAAVPAADLPMTARTDRPLVETPVLVSEKGAVVTVLNWTGAKIASLPITVRLPFAVKRAESAEHGELKVETTDAGVVVRVPVDKADFVMMYR